MWKASQRDTDDNASSSFFQSECRRAGEGIVRFICNLGATDFHDFWLPYNSFILKSTAVFLIRCALEVGDDGRRLSCLNQVQILVAALRHARREYDWDIGATCLDYWERVNPFLPKTKHEKDQQWEPEGVTESHLNAVEPAKTASLRDPMNELMDDILSDAVDLFPLDMTGIWGMTTLHDRIAT
ncbi:uncharacterized protein N7458_012827 [Penicillium daleae]|uniref:Uncharacterized protein n=1 Tax=Penicillium daleae TaxID=63821 RepID=A0AAD6BVA0_9EURO|nr:uncharacterized protein N7458_012827 [Penicillium daleae]KAJ5433671.1 hypothetical protein N7458_012827 [Penicillium daleae]